MSDLARGSVPPPAPRQPEPPAPRQPEPPPAEASRSAPAPPPAPPAAPPPPVEPAEPPTAPPAVPRSRMVSLSTQLRGTEVARAADRVEVSSPPAESLEPASQILQDLQAFLERVRDLVGTGAPFPWTGLEQILERVVRSLAAGSELFWLANGSTATKGVDYLIFHPARVAVLAVRIGMTVGYDHRRLVELGMAAALADVGLWQLPPGIVRRLGSLSRDEEAQYRAHPRAGAERLRRWEPPVEGLTETVLQHQEREQGQGFPQGLQGPSVRLDAKIVGLADTYLALIMPPTLRPGLRPHEAIREIVRSKHEAFPPAVIKALLSEISFFPPGTTVRLNTGELGTVVAVNRNHPLRPRVEVVEGKTGPLATPRIVDLSEAPFVYIVGPIPETAR